MKTVASLEVGQTGEILALLKKEQISVEVRTTLQETGLEISEILVPDDSFERGCDLVEAWHAEQLAARKRRSGVYCRKCGSRDYDEKWDERIGYTYRCKSCGDEFAW
jgi:hypothetical protein